jgi:2-succinyl-5-enolpyruvyl-6-hydroxy-3-cyclohexene-1-carboxylate synthase
LQAQVLNQQQNNINSLVSALALKGLKNVVISPGSRNAPLVMAFQRYPSIKCYSVIDERSAGFIALGMAKKTQEPVALLCTSGSAVLNYYPAISEAYYMQVPLIVISADRPPDLIDRWDGQAIHQFNVFKPHIRSSFNTPENTKTAQFHAFFDIGLKAYSDSISPIEGPVHINVPLNEPLYGNAEDDFEYPVFEMPSKIVPMQNTDLPIMDANFFSNFQKILILNGAANPANETLSALNKIKQRGDIVILNDIISGKHSENSFQNWESIVLNSNDNQKLELVPDLLITTGKMILSKSLKILLKKSNIKSHWHIVENGYCADTFYSNPSIFKISDQDFFERFEEQLPELLNQGYFNNWSKLSESHFIKSKVLNADDYNEFNLLLKFFKALPTVKLNLNISNSMSIRLAAYNMNCIDPNWEIYSNRGVSGIDGCTSTALGMALIDSSPNFLITGDLAFLYDVNAFLINEKPKNFKVLIMNNKGGGIFKNIEGPSKMKEANPYLYTPHDLNTEHIAKHYKIRYISAENQDQYDAGLNEFIQCQGLCFFEVLTDADTNTEFFKQYKQIQL